MQSSNIMNAIQGPFNAQGYNAQGYNAQGYNNLGYNAQGFNAQGFNNLGYNHLGYNAQGLNAQGQMYNPQLSGVAVTQGTFSVAPVTVATVTETVYKPVIVEEVVRTDTVVEVQPVITRHIDQTQINHIQQHVYQPAAAPSTTTVKAAAIVNEVLHPHVVNEIQEVVHKEVAVVQVQKVQERIEEHIVLPTQHSNQVVQGPAVTVAGQMPMQGNVAMAANQGGLYEGATVTPSGKLEMNRDSGTAQKLEKLAAATDIGRGMQAGGTDMKTGEPIAARHNPVSNALEHAAANAEAKQDRRTANFIA